MYAHTHTQTRTHTRTHTHTHIHTRTHTHTHTHKHARTHARTHAVGRHARTHTYTVYTSSFVIGIFSHAVYVMYEAYYYPFFIFAILVLADVSAKTGASPT